MGVPLASIIKGTPMALEDMKGKRIAIDAFNTIYQFITVIRDRMTGLPLMDSKGRVTSHLSGLLYRTSRFLEAGIKPVYVFDGKPPAWKHATIAARSEVRREAHAVWQQRVAEGAAPEEILKAAKVSARLTDEMIEQSKQLLTLMGVPWVQAPSEGEAQAAWMCAEGMAWATASQDWDSLLFGSPKLVRNLTISGKRRVPSKEAAYEVVPELFELKTVLKELGLTHEQLIAVALLMGTDYNPGVHGIGPKTALKIVREQKTLDKIIAKAVEKNPWAGPEPQELVDFYLNPPHEDKLKLEPSPLKAQELRAFMLDFEFGAERIDKVIATLSELQPKEGGLGKWTK
jgi:flap endonuclease-1